MCGLIWSFFFSIYVIIAFRTDGWFLRSERMLSGKAMFSEKYFCFRSSKNGKKIFSTISSLKEMYTHSVSPSRKRISALKSILPLWRRIFSIEKLVDSTILSESSHSPSSHKRGMLHFNDVFSCCMFCFLSADEWLHFMESHTKSKIF